MKKLLSVISLMLVMAMILSMTCIEIFAAETTGTYDAPLAQYGQKVYTTGPNYEATVSLDGKISSDEGWVCVTPDYLDKTMSSGPRYKYIMDSASAENTITDQTDEKYASDFKYYVAQDDNYIYFAIEDFAPYFEVDGTEGFTKANESLTRNVYDIRFGFDPDNYDRALHMNEWNSLWEVDIVSGTQATSIKENTAFAGIITYRFGRYAADGTTPLASANNTAVNQNHSATEYHQWIAHLEIKIDKDLVKAAYVAVFGEGADANIDFETMLVSASAWAQSDISSGAALLNAYATYGTLLSSEEAQKNNLPERAIPDVIVFGGEGMDVPTDAPETDAPTEAPDASVPVETDAPAADTDAPANETAPAADTDAPAAEGGCGGMVSLAGLALVAALGTCTVFVAKKKED